jgi:hypothetical protein
MVLSKLKEYVYARIQSLISIDVYNGIAPLEASFPYVTFNFTSSSYNYDTRADWVLELDFWNDTNDDTVLLSESELVKTGFNYYWQSEIDGFYSSYLDFESEIPTNEKDMSRINQRYLLKVR